jgi:hypothetical protein
LLLLLLLLLLLVKAAFLLVSVSSVPVETAVMMSDSGLITAGVHIS